MTEVKKRLCLKCAKSAKKIKDLESELEALKSSIATQIVEGIAKEKADKLAELKEKCSEIIINQQIYYLDENERIYNTEGLLVSVL